MLEILILYQNPFELGCSPTQDFKVFEESRKDWEIRVIRDAISRDWACLAANDLSAEQRRAIRDHLAVHVSALRDLAVRHR